MRALPRRNGNAVIYGLWPERARAGTRAAFRADLTEDEKAYALRAEIPGVKKDDTNITTEGGRVAIGAGAKNEK
jgi:HSP20 family protein